ncbi:MAG TPA: alpha/beta hydrolase [Dehalococcoidia bacterium]|nr:alpha/beta hydrolase [Dehalococcoidia bacterium]
MPFYERGDAKIYYEVRGEGFPLLLLAPGAMQSTIDFWKRAPFDPNDVYPSDFRVIAMDQRNAGQSAGPLETDDPWGMFAADQLGLLDHLGVDKFLVLGCCIGCSYILELIKRAPGRVVAGGLEQPIGIDPDGSNLELFRERIWQGWGNTLVEGRDDIDAAELQAFGEKMWGGDFVLNVTPEFVATVTTPILVMPGNDPAHPHAIGMEVARLAPGATLLEQWKEPPEIIPQTIEKIRDYFKAHVPS